MCFASYVNSVISGVPEIINIRLATLITDVAPVGTFNAATSLYVGHTWVFLDDITMNLVYGRVWSVLLSATDAAPKARSIVAGQNTLGAAAYASDSQNFDAVNIIVSKKKQKENSVWVGCYFYWFSLIFLYE